MRVLVAIALLAAPAWADGVRADRVRADGVPPWEGYWSADARWCANAGDVGEETPDWYGRDGLFGLEWSCALRAVTETGVGQSWVLQLECLDAGYADKDARIFLLTPQDRLMVLSADGIVANLVRCAPR